MKATKANKSKRIKHICSNCRYLRIGGEGLTHYYVCNLMKEAVVDVQGCKDWEYILGGSK